MAHGAREALDAHSAVSARIHGGPTEAAVAAAEPTDARRAETHVGVALGVTCATVEAGVGGARVHVDLTAPAL